MLSSIGEDVVDMIMCNAYNRAGVDEYHMTWNSFSDTISDGYERIAALPGNMPLGIGETSTTNSGGNKAQWFRDSFEDIFTKFDRIQEVWVLITNLMLELFFKVSKAYFLFCISVLQGLLFDQQRKYQLGFE